MQYNQVKNETQYFYEVVGSSTQFASSTSINTYAYFDLLYLVIKFLFGFAIIYLLASKKWTNR